MWRKPNGDRCDDPGHHGCDAVGISGDRRIFDGTAAGRTTRYFVSGIRGVWKTLAIGGSTHRLSTYPMIMSLIRLWPLGIAFLLSGCFSLGSNDKEGTAALDKERAEMLKSYRLCLQKHEEARPEAKHKCEAYREALRDLAPKTSSGTP
jgi:hypothetical protein